MNPIVEPAFSGREEIRRELRAAIVRRYEQRWPRAGFWRRLLVPLLVERDVRAELRRRFPPSANYGRSSPRIVASFPR